MPRRSCVSKKHIQMGSSETTHPTIHKRSYNANITCVEFIVVSGKHVRTTFPP